MPGIAAHGLIQYEVLEGDYLKDDSGYGRHGTAFLHSFTRRVRPGACIFCRDPDAVFDVAVIDVVFELWPIKVAIFFHCKIKSLYTITRNYDNPGGNMESVSQTGGYGYNPDHLLETLINKLRLKNDAALSRLLEVSPPMISKIRHRRLPVTASLLIRMHEVSDLSISELRELLGDRRRKFRISDQHFKPKPSTVAQPPLAQPSAAPEMR